MDLIWMIYWCLGDRSVEGRMAEDLLEPMVTVMTVSVGCSLG